MKKKLFPGAFLSRPGFDLGEVNLVLGERTQQPE
jgi:hypothetical protein